MSKAIDITGDRYGRLVVIRRVENNKRGQAMWLCQCDCGNEIISDKYRLSSGNTKSCGCIHKETLAARNRANAKHGMHGTPLYSVWHNMKDRCYREKCKEYPRYGGRGIGVCDEWKNDFGAFYDWAVANGYQDGSSIDRINNNGNYEPSNCRWSTDKEQANNRRSNHTITYNGQTHTLKEWAELYSIPYALLKNRIRANMPMEKALQKKDLRRS